MDDKRWKEWKKQPGAYNDPGDPMAVLYYNAGLFANTKQIENREERQRKVLEFYGEVCGFMRYYQGLAKRTKR